MITLFHPKENRKWIRCNHISVLNEPGMPCYRWKTLRPDYIYLRGDKVRYRRLPRLGPLRVMQCDPCKAVVLTWWP